MSEDLEKIKTLAGLNEEDDAEDSDDTASERRVDPETGKVTYVRKFGSGTKKPTDEKKAQCPLCKMYYKRLNEAHLRSIHDMTLDELREKNPEFVPYFVDSRYAIENSDYEKMQKMLKGEVAVAEEVKEDVDSKIAFHVSGILDSLGEHFKFNRLDANFVETPKRVTKALKELLKGMENTEEQLAEIFKEASTFPSPYKGMVVETNILANGICPHHLLPVKYKVHIAYFPREKKVGLSKLARCVEVLCSQAKMQEDITHEIVDAIQRYLSPEGIAIIVEGQHSCMSLRGAKQAHTDTTTALVKGCFEFNPNIRQEFYHIVSQAKKI